MASYNQNIKSRYLPERSFLYFSYPTSERTSNRLDFHFPLLENIDINENQKPNLATYDLVGRSGNLYAYLGSKSREFNLRFNITLLNVIDYMSNIGLNEIFEREIFDFSLFDQIKSTGIIFKRDVNVGKTITLNKRNLYGTAKGEWNTLNDKNKDPNDTFAELISKFERLTPDIDRRRLDEGGLLDYLDVNNPGPKVRTVSNAINYILLLINVVRTSVINRGSDSRSGPPTVYINHGTMYNNIPCICSNYTIKLNNNAGYDLVSMTPRQIEVTMTLLENRTGDFGNFEPFTPIKGENLPGWEAVISNGGGTLDPYNSKFRSE